MRQLFRRFILDSVPQRHHHNILVVKPSNRVEKKYGKCVPKCVPHAESC